MEKTDSLVPQPEFRRRVGNRSDMTFYRWRKAGILPEPIVIRGRNYWPEHVVQRLLQEGDASASQKTSDENQAA